MGARRRVLAVALALPLSGCALSFGVAPGASPMQLRMGNDCTSLFYHDPLSDPMELATGKAGRFDALRRVQYLQMKALAATAPASPGWTSPGGCR